MSQLPTLLPAPSWPPLSGVVVRPVDGLDGAGLRSFYDHLSADSRRSRFLGSGAQVSSRQCEAFCQVDHRNREGFVAVMCEQGPNDGLIVGHICLEPLEPGHEAIAVAVADSFQGRGIGRELVRIAVESARQRGVRELVASTFAANGRMLRLLHLVPGESTTLRSADGGVVEAIIPLAG
jgi:acetyltransferase